LRNSPTLRALIFIVECLGEAAPLLFGLGRLCSTIDLGLIGVSFARIYTFFSAHGRLYAQPAFESWAPVALTIFPINNHA